MSSVLATPLDPVEFESRAEPTTPRRARRELPLWLRPGTPAWTWAGVGVTVVGFVLIAIAWGQVAGEADVFLQMPYVVSAGLVGLAVVMVGVAVLGIGARQRDALDNDRQIEQLVSVLTELKEALAAQQEREQAPAAGTKAGRR